MWRLLFLLIPLLALAYALWHVWCLLPLPQVWRAVVLALFFLCFCMLFLSVGRVLDKLPMPLATAVYRTGTSSLIVMLYCVLAFLLLDALRLLHIVPPSLLRSNLWTTVGLLLVIGALLVCGNVHYHHKVRQSLSLTTRKRVGQEVRLLMASDLHLGYHIRRGELRGWVDMINAEHPDVILLAGDLVDRSMKPLFEEDMAAELRRLEAPVFACLGNHEYYCDETKAEAFYKAAGITLLRDSVATWQGLCIVGRDDRTNPRRKSLAELMEKADKGKYIVLLDHQPWDIGRSAEEGVDFQLSGHTHHGQVFPISLATDAIYTVAHGAYKIGDTRFFVSSGLGIWGGKFRIGTCSEYIIATLQGE
ncbi:MAG: metallophosphoesterase [Prevotellaceae bacterium]|nr:metallophosphoesterase [Prevotellaceae bacterium]